MNRRADKGTIANARTLDDPKAVIFGVVKGVT